MKKVLMVSLGMAVVVAGLAAYVLVFETEPKPKHAPGTWQPTPILEQEGVINKMTLIRPDGPVVLEFAPKANAWIIKEPVETFSDPYFFDGLIQDLPKIIREKLIDVNPEDLSRYNLDQPQGEIVYHFIDGRPDVHLLIGKMNYRKTHLYAKLKSKPAVFLIDLSIRTYVFAPFYAFRLKSLLFHKPEEILSLEIKILDPELKKELSSALEPKLVVQKRVKQKPQWVIVKPVSEKALFKAVDKFFNSLRNITTKTVLDPENDDYSPFGLDRPQAKIILDMVNGRKEEIIFSAPDKEKNIAYARNMARPEVLLLSKGFFYEVISSNFRKDLVFEQTRKLQLSSIAFEFPSDPRKNFIIEHEEGRIFFLADDPEKKVLWSTIKWVLNPFKVIPQTYISHFEPLPRESYGLDPAYMRIKAYEGGEIFMDVSIGNTVRVNEKLFTHFQDNMRKCILAIPKNLIEVIPHSPEHFIATPQSLEKIKKREQRRKNKKK